MEYRKSNACDIKGLKKLWQECFFDEMDYIDFYFDNMHNEDYCYVAVDGQKICSMQMFLPATMKRAKDLINGRYVYAVATDKYFRKKSIMKNLHHFASEDVKQKGASFLNLVPATQSLFNLYSQIGYKPYVYLQSITLSKNEFDIESILTKVELIPTQNLNILRDEFLSQFEESVYINNKEYVTKELEYLKAKLYKVTNDYGTGYIICLENEQGVFIKECSLSEKMLRSSLKDICKTLKTEKILLKLSQKINKGINKMPYSMIKWLKKDEFCNLDTYQNLMLD